MVLSSRLYQPWPRLRRLPFNEFSLGVPLKRSSRILAASLTLAVFVTACGSKEKTASPTTNSSGGATSSTAPKEATKATEVGISETEIRIAVLADVENKLLNGLFKGSKDAVIAFEKYVNDAGGIAGRKLKVDFIDTHLNSADVKTALQTACKNDFALVGTTLALAESFDPMLKCKDQAGSVTGLPDFAAISVDPKQQGSKVTFAGLPPERDFSVKDAQKFSVRVVYQYLKDHAGVSHGMYLNSADSQTAKNGNAGRFYAAQKTFGITDDGGGQTVSAFATESDFLPFAQTMKTKHSNFAESGGTFQELLKFRRAAKQVGVTGVTWSCVLTCYDQGLLKSAADAEGTYVNIPFIPFFDPAEQAAIPAAKTFVDAVGLDNANGFGLQAWASALLFQRTVNQIVTKAGVNGVTRSSVLAEVATIHDFDANGLVGKTDVGDRRPNDCLVLLQLKGGKFVRVAPTDVGKFDCKPANLSTFTADIWPKS